MTFQLEEVLCLQNEKMQQTFDLVSKIAPKIGRRFGIRQDDITRFAKSKSSGDQQIKWVLDKWFNQPDSLANMDLYSLSWDGLKKLLMDSGLS